LDWKYYVPNGCHWVSGNSVVELRVCYKWDTPNKSKRTVKFYSKIALYEKNYYFQIQSAGANRDNGATGFNILMSINSGSYVSGNNVRIDEYSSVTHEIELCSTSTTLNYNDNGKVSPKINYDLYFKWYFIYEGSIDKLDAKGTYTVTDVTSIDPTSISSITLNSNSIFTKVVPNKVTISGNVSTINAGKTATYSGDIAKYATSKSNVGFSVKPIGAKGKLTFSSNKASIADVINDSVNVSNSNTFTVASKKPGKAKITVKSNNNKTANLTVTVSSNNKLSWSSSNTAIATVDNNGKITAKSGVNGSTTITVKSVSNSSAKADKTLNVLLPPNNISITANKTEIYPGESVKFNINIEPYNSTNSAKCVASNYRASKYIIMANTGSATTALTDYSNKNSNSYSVTYQYNDYVTPAKKIYIDVDSTIKTNLSNTKSITVKAPTISTNRTSVALTKGGNSEKIKVDCTPNGRFTYTYNPNYITVTSSNGILTVTGKKDIANTKINITGEMPIVASTMTKPTTSVNVSVGAVPISTIWISGRPSKLTEYLLPKGIGFINADDYNDTTEYSRNILRTTPYVTEDNKNVSVYFVMSPGTSTKSVNIEYTPKNASGNIKLDIINARNESGIEDNIVEVDNNSRNISVYGNNGKLSAKLNCIKPGNATLRIRNNSNQVLTTIPIEVIFNRNDYRITSNNYDLAPFQIPPVVDSRNYTHLAIVHTSGHDWSPTTLKTTGFNGTAQLTVALANNIVSGMSDSDKSHSLNFTNYLIPKKLTLTSNVDSIYIGDTIKLSFLLEPYSEWQGIGGITKSVASKYRNVVIEFKNSDGETFDSYVYSGICKKDWEYTIPNNPLLEKDGIRFIDIVAYDGGYDFGVISTVRLQFNRVGLTINNSSNDRNIILANTTAYKDIDEQSKEKLSIKTNPPSIDFSVTDTNSKGFIINLFKSIDESILTVSNTRYRYIYYNNREANKKDTVYTTDMTVPLVDKLKGGQILVKYTGPLTSNQTAPKININVFTCEYFGKPKIINADSSNTVYYYNDRPKLILQLPNINDFDILEDIEIRFANDRTYSFTNNPECFSSSFITNTFKHYKLTSALIDYELNGNAYCVFIPTTSLINTSSNVTITFKSRYNTIPDSSTTIKLNKRKLPVLPNVGDFIKIDDVKQFVAAIELVLKPYYTVNNSLFNRLTDFLYGINSINTNSIGIVGSNIQAMTFFKLLFALNKTITTLSKTIDYLGIGSRVPEQFLFKNVRQMLVSDDSRDYWYNRYILSNDEYKASNYQLVKDMEDLGYDFFKSITDEHYPIMVNDNNEFIGNPEFNIINDYKDTEIYDDYTISPLTEIIKALKQF
jgi:hypothetical protein